MAQFVCTFCTSSLSSSTSIIFLRLLISLGFVGADSIEGTYSISDSTSSYPASVSALCTSVYTAGSVIISKLLQKYSPEEKDRIEEYIKNKETMFIVYYTLWDEKLLKAKEPYLFLNYDLIMSIQQDFEEFHMYGYLFKVKST